MAAHVFSATFNAEQIQHTTNLYLGNADNLGALGSYNGNAFESHGLQNRKGITYHHP